MVLQVPGKQLIFLQPFMTTVAKYKHNKFEIDYQSMLEGVALASALLLKSVTPEDVFPQVVTTIGQATRVDRCYIFKNFYLEGHAYMSQQYEWVRDGVSIQIDNPALQKITYDILPGLYAQLSRRKDYSGLVRESTDEFRAMMEAQDIVSYLLLPIFMGETFWGFIGYDDCQHDKIWTTAEINTLATLAAAIGAFLVRHKLETELREKNAQYELALRGSQDGIWELDYRTGKIFTNRQWREMFGFRHMTEYGLTLDLFLELLHPADRKRVEGELNDYLKRGKGTLDLEYRIQHAKGHYIWIYRRSAAEWDENGEPVRLGGSDSDITERKIHDKLLADNEKQYRELINNLNDVIFETDHQGRFTFLNKAWEDLTGYTVAESIGLKGADFVLREDAAIIPMVSHKMNVLHKNSVSEEFRYRRKNGEAVWVHMVGNKVFDHKGELTGFNGTISNIQSRREAEIRLIESEAKYRLISENMTDLVTQHDFEGRVKFASSSLRDWLGYDAENLPSLDSFYYFHPDDINHIRANAVEKLKQGEKSVTINYRLRHAEGHYLWVESLTKYVYNEKHQMVAIQVSTRNITERKQAEEDIRHALEKEKELRDLKSRFVVMASHEFRTPLATIQSSLDLLQHYTELDQYGQPSKTERHFVRIRSEIKKVTDLMNDILLLGKLEAGHTKMKLESTDLIELVNELIEGNFSQGKDPRIPVFDYSGFPRNIFADQQLLRHALSNLISNALKFSKEKPNPQLRINYLKNKVRITITDFGIGIPRNEKNRIFESFYRGTNTTEFQGTGLGLVIAKEFVEMHRGIIWFESNPGKKTVFTIELNL